MNSKTITIALKALFSFGLLLFLFYRLDFKMLNELKIDAIIPFLIAVVITLAAIAVMAYRWKLLISEFLKKHVPYKLLYKYYLIGSFFNIFLPGAIGGDVIRTQRLSIKQKINIKGATAITLGERFAGVFGLLILLSLSFTFRNFPDGLQVDKFLPGWFLIISPLLVFAMIPILKWVLLKYKLQTNYTFLTKTILVLLFAQMGDITIAYIFSRYFELDIQYSAFIFIMPLVYIATVLPISLGGLGVREGSFAGLMILYGADTSISIMIALLMYLVKIVTGIFGYFVYLKEK